jgi:hypothetical protein
MQTQASVALIAPCREERIERFAPDANTHAAAVVRKKKGANHVLYAINQGA